MNTALATVTYNIFTKCELNGMHSFGTINPVYSHKHALFRHHKKNNLKRTLGTRKRKQTINTHTYTHTYTCMG